MEGLAGRRVARLPLDPEAERAGLRKGDIVVGVNGRPVQGWSDIYGPVRRARTGDHLLLRVKRTSVAGSVEEDISVPLRRFTYVGYAPGSAFAALLVFPLAMAYVIVVHRAMDVRVVLRQGLQYLLATSGVRPAAALDRPPLLSRGV